jgi:1-deoxy-D-xylulose-5-phosphate synthase
MTSPDRYPRLRCIESPADLRALPEADLPEVADELRAYLIDTVSQMGGHFAAGLGTVELTLALHYVYDTPADRLVWDVGHQAYPHKVLTGRRDRLQSIKLKDGLAPFPSRGESEYDTFGVGHSSTSISAALGMAIASAQAHPDRTDPARRRVVAVIGDGAMSAGLAFEALNHAGSLDVDLLVVLNDNDMSISENVGALSNYFARVLSGRLYSGLREGSKKVLRRMPAAWELARRSEEHMKGMVLPGTMFEEMGFNYIGPIDGHDLGALVKTLKNLRTLRGPQFLHVATRKGKGYAPAEADPIKWHGPGPFDPLKGEIFKEKTTGPAYSQVFGQWLCDMAARDPRVVGITPAMREGSGMVEFSKRFPERYFDVAIAEQHAVTFAAGLACEGLRPVVAIYSTFLQRAYDQLIHDVNLQKLPVLFAIDRAGLVGPDGATHNGNLDLSYMRCLPGLVVLAPSDGDELRDMLHTGLVHDGPVAVRYPRANVPPMARRAPETLPIGLGEVRRTGSGCAILAFGTMLQPALEAGEMLGATVANMRCVKPLDEELVLELARTHELLVTIEENAVAGGAGAGVGECLAARGVSVPLLHLGLPDRHAEHGTRDECLRDAGLDVQGVFDAVSARLGRDGIPRHLGALGSASVATHEGGGRVAAERAHGRVLTR